MSQTIFELIRYSLDPEAEMPEDLDKIDWEEMFQFAEEQSILGVMYEGRRKMERLRVGELRSGMGGKGEDEFLDDLTLEWGFLAQQIEEQNKKVNETALKLSKELKKRGFECCILKGQGNNLMYPNSLARMPGDIDVWVRRQNNKKRQNNRLTDFYKSHKNHRNLIKEIVRYVKERNPEARAVYHHIDYGKYDDIEVEVHYRPSFLNDPRHNHRLQKWFEKHADEQFGHCVELPHTEPKEQREQSQISFELCRVATEEDESQSTEITERVCSRRVVESHTDGTDDTDFRICVPTEEFNTIYLLAHIYKHLLHEGVGLRQIIDYYYLLRQNNKKRQNNRLTDFKSPAERAEIEDTLRYLGLWKIAGAVMWVLSEVLGLEERYLIAPKDERLGKVLLSEILHGGNFGQHDPDNIKADSQLKKNWQRIRRDFRMVRYFPSECLWEPVFRVYHFFWRLRYN
jgi:hypothetical protein